MCINLRKTCVFGAKESISCVQDKDCCSQKCLKYKHTLGACATARHCIHFPPVFQVPPSGHPPGRCMAHPHLLGIGHIAGTHPKGPPQVDRQDRHLLDDTSAPPQHTLHDKTAIWWTTPQYHPNTHYSMFCGMKCFVMAREQILPTTS